MHSIPALAVGAPHCLRFDDLRNRIIPRQPTVVQPLGGHPLVKERVHIHGKVFDDRQIAQGADAEPGVLRLTLSRHASGRSSAARR